MKRIMIVLLALLVISASDGSAQNYTLTVNVSKAGGGPALQGVTVKLNPPGTFTAGSSTSGLVSSQPGFPQGTTDITGNVVLSGVAAGNYTLAVFKNDCQTRNTGYTMPASNASIDMSINCGSGLTVNVLQTQGMTKSAVAGAQVQLTGQSNSAPLTQMTDQTGQAVFPNVYNGTYTVQASKSGCSQSSQSFSMPLKAASTALALNCQNKKLTVMVFEAGTLMGKQAKWIAGAKVRLAPKKNPGKYVEATTDKYGRAVFDNVTAGAHLMTTSNSGCSSKTTTYTMPASSATVQVDLACGGSKTTLK